VGDDVDLDAGAEVAGEVGEEREGLDGVMRRRGGELIAANGVGGALGLDAQEPRLADAAGILDGVRVSLNEHGGLRRGVRRRAIIHMVWGLSNKIYTPCDFGRWMNGGGAS